MPEVKKKTKKQTMQATTRYQSSSIKKIPRGGPPHKHIIHVSE